MLCLCAISLDGLLSANWPALRPWGLLRIGFMVVMMAWDANRHGRKRTRGGAMWTLIAAVLGQKASAEDLDRGAECVGRDYIRPVLSRPNPLGDHASD